MSKRPQTRSGAGRPSTGVPTGKTDVVATPVNTVETLGTAGMPAMTEALTGMPISPDILAEVNNQDVKDKLATAAAFEGMSTSLRGAAFAHQEHVDMLEDGAAKLSAYIDFTNTENLTFTRALSDKEIQAMDHPRFQAVLAEQAARNRAGLIKDQFRDKVVQLRAGDNAYNINAYESELNGLYASQQHTFKGLRNDIYKAELEASFRNTKEFLLAKERAWISEENLKLAQVDLVTSTNSVVEKMAALPKEAGAELKPLDPNSDDPVSSYLGRMGFQQTVGIKGETEEELYARQVNTAAVELTGMLDGRRNGLLSSSIMNKIVGFQLIELAKNNPRHSKFAEDILKTIQTGPPDSRAPLLSGEVKSEYLSVEGQIRNRQNTFNRQLANKAFRSSVDMVSDTLVEGVVNLRLDPSSRGRTSLSLITNAARDQVGPKGRTTLPDGSEVRLNGNTLTFFPSPDSGADAPVSMNLETLAKNADAAALHKASHEEHVSSVALGTGASRSNSEASASIATGVKSNALLSDLEQGAAQNNEYLLLTDENRPEYVSRMRDNLNSYKILKKGGMTGDLTSSSEDYYELLDLITSDDELRFLGGSNMEDALAEMARVTDEQRSAAKDRWTTEEGSKTINDVYVSSGELNAPGFQYIEKVAKAMLAMSPNLTVEEAVNRAYTSHNERFRLLTDNVRYDSNEWNPDEVSTGLQQKRDADWDTTGWLMSTMFGGTETEWSTMFETWEQTALVSPQILDGLWTAWTNRNPKDNRGWNEILGAVNDASLRALKNARPGEVPVSFREVLEGAAENLKTIPPDYFTVNYQTTGDYTFVDFKWVPVEGTKGQFFRLMGIREEGAARVINYKEIEGGGGRPFSRADIINIYSRQAFVEPVDKWPAGSDIWLTSPEGAFEWFEKYGNYKSSPTGPNMIQPEDLPKEDPMDALLREMKVIDD